MYEDGAILHAQLKLLDRHVAALRELVDLLDPERQARVANLLQTQVLELEAVTGEIKSICEES